MCSDECGCPKVRKCHTQRMHPKSQEFFSFDRGLCVCDCVLFIVKFRVHSFCLEKRRKNKCKDHFSKLINYLTVRVW